MVVVPLYLHVARNECLDAFRRKLVFHHIVREEFFRVPRLSAITANHLHLGRKEGFVAILAGIYRCRAVIVHTDMTQEVAALGAAQLPVVKIRGFGGHIRATEVMEHVFLVDVGTAALGTSLRK